MVAGSRGDASQVFLFSVWQRDAYLYRRAVRMDGRNSDSRDDRTEMEAALPRKLPSRYRAKDHSASSGQPQHADQKTLTNSPARQQVFIVAMRFRHDPVHSFTSMNRLSYRRVLPTACLMLAPLIPAWTQQT